jgi:hypothetical protein
MLKVAVDIYGRFTPVKITFWDAEKLEFEPPSPPTSSQN